MFEAGDGEPSTEGEYDVGAVEASDGDGGEVPKFVPVSVAGEDAEELCGGN